MQITKITSTSKEVSTPIPFNTLASFQTDTLTDLSDIVAEIQNAQASQEAKLNLAMLISMISLITSVAELALAIV